MAEGAIRREARGRVIRIRRLVEVRLMTSVTGGGKGRVIVIYVALSTHNSCMRSSQWERGLVEIKARESPRSCVVALRTVSGKS